MSGSFSEGFTSALTFARNKHGHDKSIHRDNAGHDYRNERLLVGNAEISNETQVEGRRTHTFMISSGLKEPNPAMPIPALDVPYAAPTAITQRA
jgi:hypothetical protein